MKWAPEFAAKTAPAGVFGFSNMDSDPRKYGLLLGKVDISQLY
jgi:hypothetical protein